VSFTGDLEDLPIVDVMQLLHATRKSGILRLKGRKGESDLVFKDGYIVSASHLNNSVRIGTILIERNIITPEILNQTLLEQKNAGAERKPLIVALLDKGLVKDQDAYQGLEHLIELTIVEILTWKRGTFTLEVLRDAIADGYRYYPGKINREINVDVQGALMDALRVFDEKMRDGELTEEEIPENDSPVTGTVPAEEGPALSANDVGRIWPGLENLEREVKKTRQQYAASESWLMQEEEWLPSAPVVTEPILYIGRGFVLAGFVVLACGVMGLYDYGRIQPAEAAIPELYRPPGPLSLYLTHGLLPTLQALLGIFTAMAGSQYLKMRPGAGKRLEAAAWSGIVFAVVSELDNMIASITWTSSSPSFWYYLVQFIGFILTLAFWTVPLLAAVWFLRRYVNTDVFTSPALWSQAPWERAGLTFEDNWTKARRNHSSAGRRQY
jgi:hypothetical protein